jgi:hypothetical protein
MAVIDCRLRNRWHQMGLLRERRSRSRVRVGSEQWLGKADERNSIYQRNRLPQHRWKGTLTDLRTPQASISNTPPRAPQTSHTLPHLTHTFNCASSITVLLLSLYFSVRQGKVRLPLSFQSGISSRPKTAINSPLDPIYVR